MLLKRILKIVIVILIIVLTTLIICIYTLSNKSVNNKIIDAPTYDEKVDENLKNENQEILLQDINEYSRLKTYLKTFLLYQKANNKQAIQEITNSEGGIWINKIPKDYSEIIMQEVYQKNVENISINFIKFKFYKYAPEFYGVIILDNNKTFKIIESDKVEYENARINNIAEKYLSDIKIEAKKYNGIKNVPKRLDEQEIVKLYFNDYIEKALYYPEEAYNLLDKEYAKAKFGEIKEYKSYLRQRVNQLKILDVYTDTQEVAQIEKYSSKAYSSYKQYICVDSYNNYYIFNVTGAMKYTVLLDSYTIDMPQTVEKYNNSSDKEKIILNIKKIFQAINAKDYNYVYNKLDNNFKNNYFKSELDFEKYIKSNFFEKNEISTKEYEKRQDTHIISINIKDSKDKAKKGISRKIIMQLKEGTEFVMSFNID